MNIPRAAVIVVAGIVIAACSHRSPETSDDSQTGDMSGRAAETAPASAEGENEKQPAEDEIAEDCVAFVRSTKVVPPQVQGADCPTCPAEGTEVLAFRQMKTDKISCSGDTCQVSVTLRAAFSPATGERLAGGLTAWIPPEQRSEYLSGRPPSGEQAYRVKITYKRRAEGWRAVEFDRSDAE